MQDAAFRLGLPFHQHLRAWYGGPIIPGLTRAVAGHPADLVVTSSLPLRHVYQALAGARRAGRPCILPGGIHPEDRCGYDRPVIHRAIRKADRSESPLRRVACVLALIAVRDEAWALRSPRLLADQKPCPRGQCWSPGVGGGRLAYFGTKAGSSLGASLVETDGTAAGTRQVMRVLRGRTQLDSG